MFLSASRIKTYNTCSWLYHAQYHLGLRDIDGSNDGAKRGTICHLILEVLLNPRHQKYIVEIVANGTDSIPSVWRLVLKHAKILQVDDDANLKLIKGFISTGLKADYFCQEVQDPNHNGEKFWELQKPEKKFQIESENPEYKILGFIDKNAISCCGKKGRVDDYKTSKAKFTGKDKDFNVQGLMYALALWKELDLEEVDVNFLFLKFPKDPWQRFKFTDKHLKGFEVYLSEIYLYLKDFNTKKATSNFARFNDSYFLCGKEKGALKKDGSPAWVCSLKYPFVYYELKNKEGKIIGTSKIEQDMVDKMKEGDTIEEKLYLGCPAWMNLK